jgi:hypothetical protein
MFIQEYSFIGNFLNVFNSTLCEMHVMVVGNLSFDQFNFVSQPFHPAPDPTSFSPQICRFDWAMVEMPGRGDQF